MHTLITCGVRLHDSSVREFGPIWPKHDIDIREFRSHLAVARWPTRRNRAIGGCGEYGLVAPPGPLQLTSD